MATLTQLEYLVAVDRLRHFGKAAKACHVSQPTLSMQLQKLEEEYDIIFFDRSKQPILPSPEAQPIIKQAKVILREMGKLEYLCKSGKQKLSGEFKLAIIPTIAPYLLPLFLQSFAEHYPEVELTIEEMTTESIIRALEEDQIDAGILATPLHIELLVERVLYYEPFFLYVSENHPLARLTQISEDKLDAKDIWLLSEGHCLRNQVIRICSLKNGRGIFPNIHLESGSLETLIHLVEQGHGFTLLPYLATLSLKHSKKMFLKPFIEPVPSRETSLVFRRTQYKQAILDALAQGIQKQIPVDLPQEKSKKIGIVRI